MSGICNTTITLFIATHTNLSTIQPTMAPTATDKVAEALIPNRAKYLHQVGQYKEISGFPGFDAKNELEGTDDVAAAKVRAQ